MSYEVRAHPLAEPMGSLLGFCELHIAGVIISDFRVMVSPDGTRFVVAPTMKTTATGPTGATKYHEVVTFQDEALKASIYNKMLEAF